MNLQHIKRAQSATVVIGYALPKGVPEWRGTGFLVADGSYVVTCYHVVKDCKRFVEENSIKKDLRCFLFCQDKKGVRIINFPIVGVSKISLLEIGSTFFGSENLDVSFLKIDISSWEKIFAEVPIPKLEVDESMACEVGDDVIQVGYPSPHYLIAQKTGEPNALEPLVQFGKIAGILPFSNAPLPHLIAVDIFSTPGSSGSPMISTTNGKVIGISCEILPNLWRQPVLEESPDGRKLIDSPQKMLTYPIPTGITHCIPSNLFAEKIKNPEDPGKFEIKSRWESDKNIDEV